MRKTFLLWLWLPLFVSSLFAEEIPDYSKSRVFDGSDWQRFDVAVESKDRDYTSSMESLPSDKDLSRPVGYRWQYRKMIIGRAKYEEDYKYHLAQSMLHMAAFLANNPEPYKGLSVFAVVKAMDKFYSDPDNYRVQGATALSIVCRDIKKNGGTAK